MSIVTGRHWGLTLAIAVSALNSWMTPPKVAMTTIMRRMRMGSTKGVYYQ